MRSRFNVLRTVPWLAFRLLALAVVAIGFVSLSPHYPVKQGTFSVVVDQVYGGDASRTFLEVTDESGRKFVVTAPSTEIFEPGDRVHVSVACKTSAHKSCAARYVRNAAP